MKTFMDAGVTLACASDYPVQVPSPPLLAIQLDQWRDAAQMHQGSWWPHWSDWLAAHSTKQVKARVPGKVTGTLCDAPGTYVAVRFDQRDA